MKKFFLILAAAFCVATVSAQSTFESSVQQAAQVIASQKWSVGARIGSGFQAQAECFYAGDKYLEGRFGMSWAGGKGYLGADFTVLHNWNLFRMDWTPDVGEWFFDAGVGLNVGGAAHVATLGIAGQAKIGIKFSEVPIRLAFDVTPSFGPKMSYGNGKGNNPVDFHTWGLCNLGISATYCF